MSAASRRAQERRLTWTSEVVPAGAPKQPAYADMTTDQRIRAFIELNRFTWWTALGEEPAATSRATWPGEVVDLRQRR